MPEAKKKRKTTKLAIVTITVRDNEDGSVTLEGDNIPENPKKQTPAQGVAAGVLQAMQDIVNRFAETGKFFKDEPEECNCRACNLNG